MLDYPRVALLAQQPEKSALCIITETSGSTPRKAGARMVVTANGAPTGKIEGTIGGGAVENQVRMQALEAIKEGCPRVVSFSLTQELAMCCGGKMTAYIEPLQTKVDCIIFGAGHISEALCRLASQAGFNIYVADPRSEQLTLERFPLATALIDGYSPSDLDRLPACDQALVVIATHSHELDQTLIELILRKPIGYVALVGSQRKALLTKKRCLVKGFHENMVNSIHCPAGLDVGAETPEEIAVSIMAEMIQWRRRKAAH